ncbi:FTR1 family iron permease [Microbulbifer sediminum]|uniref:FTR1 family iron permease n=1 Tax=Microbulbifer sediminum TaxID=2904250 RepID=UPI001EFFC936|nr:FTR1 family protein [Microbulbifer sediminum]
MLLNTVIIILREVLEAALLISILLAMSRLLRLTPHWVSVSVIVGAAGAVFVGTQLGDISQLLDGVGQEVFDASLQLLICTLMLWIAVLLTRSFYLGAGSGRGLPQLMAVTVALAIIREGSEIYLYLSAFVVQADLLPGVLTGTLLGAGIGFSVGALFYYLLLGLPCRYTLGVACGLLALVAAGMSLQATQLLIQADWLPAQAPLWNSGDVLPEASVAGQLLYALLGYEASPSPVEVTVYLLSVLLMLGVLFLARQRARSREVGERQTDAAPMV